MIDFRVASRLLVPRLFALFGIEGFRLFVHRVYGGETVFHINIAGITAHSISLYRVYTLFTVFKAKNSIFLADSRAFVLHFMT